MKRFYVLLMASMGWYGAFSQNINKVEYFIDTDPGYGSATNVPVTAAPGITNLAFSVPLTSVSDGFHTLFVRSRDVNSKWSLVTGRPFVKLAIPNVTPNLSLIEYFIDTDPGYGSGTSVTFTAGITVTNQSFTIPLSSVGDGFHTLFVRTKDASNNWSLVTNRPFVKLNVPVTLPNITKLEYFIDTDPGYGSATNVAITAASSISNLNFTVDVSAQTQGAHQLFVRAKDANNKWSLVYERDFTVCNGSPTTAQTATSITPTGFTANWSAVSGSTFKLDVSSDNFNTFVSGYQDQAVATTSQSVIGLNNGTSYQYRVRAVGSCTSVSSNVISATTLLATPVVSAGTVISQAGFTANWTAVNFATGYQLDVSTDNFATFVTGYNSKSTATNSEILTGLTANTVYQYRVRAIKTGATSTNSSTISVTTTTVAPVANTASTITQTGFTASWGSVTGATSYRLDVSADNFATLLTGYSDLNVGNVTSKAITGLTSSATYQFRVRAVNAGGASANSNVVSATTFAPGTAPVAPVAVAATVASSTGFTANWNAVTGATGYQLDISTDAFATFITGYNSKSITSTSEIVSGLSATTAYKYRVRAVNASGVSTNSNAVDISTLAPAPPAPVAVAATAVTPTGFTANWNAATGATGYQLDISTDNFATFITGYNAKATTATSEIVTGLTPSTAYKYRVRSVNGTSASANSNSIDVTTSAKQNQTITFSSVADKTLGDAAFDLGATASSSLAVSYATTSDKITISGPTVTLVKAGRVTVTASQAGNASFNAATSVDQSFCIKPPKPTIALSGANTESITLTSSNTSGNQWFLNGTAIPNAANATLAVTQPGVYKVQTTADDCSSAFSDNTTLIVTGELSNPLESIKVFPNPLQNYLQVTGIKEINESLINDSMGRAFPIELKKDGDVYRGDVQSLPNGLYVLQIRQDNCWHQIKFLKN